MHGCGDWLGCCMLKEPVLLSEFIRRRQRIRTDHSSDYSTVSLILLSISLFKLLTPVSSLSFPVYCLLFSRSSSFGGRGGVEVGGGDKTRNNNNKKTAHNSLNSSKYTFLKKGDAIWLFMELIQINSSWKQTEILNLIYVLNWDKINNGIFPRASGLTPLLLRFRNKAFNEWMIHNFLRKFQFSSCKNLQNQSHLSSS